MKKCSKCDLEKEETEFYKKQGITISYCKQCHSNYLKEYRRTHYKTLRICDRKYMATEQGKLARKKANEIYNKKIEVKLRRKELRKNNYDRIKNKISAELKINYLVRKNKIIKPTECSLCKTQTSSINMCGHHPDYSKPLEVIWVCRSCHSKIHNSKKKHTMNVMASFYGTDPVKEHLNKYTASGDIFDPEEMACALSVSVAKKIGIYRKWNTVLKITHKDKIIHVIYNDTGPASWLNSDGGKWEYVCGKCHAKYSNNITEFGETHLCGGKFIKTRDIDLTRGAFEKLAPLDLGIIEVEVEEL